METRGDIVIYKSKNGKMNLHVKLENDTVWLTQDQMVKLFKRSVSVISRHIKNMFKEKELEAKSNLHFLQIANSDKPVALYSLDVVISVGYRVKSREGTLFRIWARNIIKDYIVKGYAVNEKRINEAGDHRLRQIEESAFANSNTLRVLSHNVAKFIMQAARRDVLNAVIDDVEKVKLRVKDIELLQGTVKQIQVELNRLKEGNKKE